MNQGKKGATRLLVYGELQLEPRHLYTLAANGVETRTLEGTASLADVLQAIDDCDAVLFNNVDINPLLPHFGTRRIGLLAATGYSFIDLETARQLGVRLARLVAYSATAVTEYLVWSAINALRPLQDASRRSRDRDWCKQGLFGRELSGRTAGIIGQGRIGRPLGDQLRALGMRVLVTTRASRDRVTAGWRPLSDLVGQSDILFVCCDANPSSIRLLGREHLEAMRQGAVLVSISPNEVIDLDALAVVLQLRGDLKAVLDLDPISDGHALLGCPSVTITPHVAFATKETLSRRVDESVETLLAALRGETVAWISPTQATESRPVAIATSDMLARRDSLLELASGFYYARSLHTLVECGILDALQLGRRSAQALVELLGLDAAALGLLLDAAAALGLLERDAEGYAIAEAYRDLLRPDSPYFVGPMVASVIESSYEPWGRLTNFVRDGRPPRVNQKLREESLEWARRLTRGSNSVALPIAEALELHLQGRPLRSLLDIGCGPAALTRTLLRRFPTATADLIDRRMPLQACVEDFLIPEGLTGRCRLIDRDFTDGRPFPTGQDIAILTNVVHMIDAEAARDLLRRSADALLPGGRLVVSSFFANPEKEQAFSRHFSISCRLLSGSARGYTVQEALAWIGGLKLENVQLVSIGLFTSVIIAEKACSDVPT